MGCGRQKGAFLQVILKESFFGTLYLMTFWDAFEDGSSQPGKYFSLVDEVLVSVPDSPAWPLSTAVQPQPVSACRHSKPSTKLAILPT